MVSMVKFPGFFTWNWCQILLSTADHFTNYMYNGLFHKLRGTLYIKTTNIFLLTNLRIPHFLQQTLLENWDFHFFYQKLSKFLEIFMSSLPFQPIQWLIFQEFIMKNISFNDFHVFCRGCASNFWKSPIKTLFHMYTAIFLQTSRYRHVSVTVWETRHIKTIRPVQNRGLTWY